MRTLKLRREVMLSLLFCGLSLFGNVRNAESQKTDLKRPGVYITFQGFVRKTANEASLSPGARFALHNNTRWPIHYGEWMERALPGDAAIIYTIELETGCREPRRHIDVVTGGKLLPGKTVSFTVPREDFPKDSEIFVEFNFSWELAKDETVPNECIHRAYFSSIALPEWPRP